MIRLRRLAQLVLQVDDTPTRVAASFGLGVFIDVDLDKKRRWAFSSSVRYLIFETTLTTEVRNDEPGGDPTRIVSRAIDIDPWVLHAGVAYRF